MLRNIKRKSQKCSNISRGIKLLSQNKYCWQIPIQFALDFEPRVLKVQKYLLFLVVGKSGTVLNTGNKDVLSV